MSDDKDKAEEKEGAEEEDKVELKFSETLTEAELSELESMFDVSYRGLSKIFKTKLILMCDRGDFHKAFSQPQDEIVEGIVNTISNRGGKISRSMHEQLYGIVKNYREQVLEMFPYLHERYDEVLEEASRVQKLCKQKSMEKREELSTGNVSYVDKIRR